MNGALIAIVGFLVALTALGAWYARRVRTAEDFALAGRRLGAPVLVGTLVATWTGTGSLFGNAEFAVRHGVAAFLLPVASGVGIVALAFLAPRARALPAQTVPQILGIRFGTAAQRLGAVTLIGAYLIIVSYQYRAGATFAGRLFPDAEPWQLTVAFAFFVIVFTALAGMFSVAMTDVVCGGVMAVGLLVALALLVGDAREAHVSIPDDMKNLTGGKNGIFWLGVLLPGFLLILGDANLYQRFLSARTPATARRSAVGMFFGVMLVDWTIIGVALLGGLMLMAPPDNPAHVVVDVAFELMPAGIGVLIAAAGFAIIISTADSYLLASATSAAGDLVAGWRRPAWQRVLVVILGLTALNLAFLSDEYFNVALYAYTLYGASLTPAVLLALLRPATTPAVVIAGMAAGLAATLFWKVLLWRELLGEALNELQPVIPALAANVLAMAIVAVAQRARAPR